jgi:hypothetical protein
MTEEEIDAGPTAGALKGDGEWVSDGEERHTEKEPSAINCQPFSKTGGAVG